MRTWMRVLIIVVVMVLLVGCAAGPNPMQQPRETNEQEPAGFWLGLWHGIIAPITFVISLFSDKVHMYEVVNNGNWYNFGFMLGAGILFGGGSKAGRRKKRDD